MTYDNQRTRELSTRKLRELLRRDYGARCYRITRNDEIHIYGVMPRSIVTGWWLLGARRWVEHDYLF